jgi:hypothetical protein
MPPHTNTEDRYLEAQIYKVVNTDCDDIYIGSTNYKHLSKRYWRHRRDGYDERFKHRYGKLFSTENHSIQCIEKFPCRNKEELRNRERYWIERTPTAVNSVMPIITNEQRLEKNRQRQKEWYKTQNGKDLKKISNERFRQKNPDYYKKKKAEKMSYGNILLKFD